MKRWKKVALALLLIALLSQAPFVYRRYRLGQLKTEIASLNASRTAATQGDFADYKGVIHVHSFLGGHSTGTFDEIVRAARSNSLDFVVMTEHPSADVDTSAATLRGVHDGVLFVNGSEMVAATGERFLVVPGVPADAGRAGASELIGNARESGRLVFFAYPEEVRDWTALAGVDGIEVYNLFTNSKRINYPILFFDCLWSCGSYPELLFTTFYERPDENLRRWDEWGATSARRYVAVAGNDAHSNVRLGIGTSSDEPLVGFKLDPYERSFQLVRNHVLVDKNLELNTENLLDALKRGHSYVSFDLFCDATGFRFTADNGSERRVMGDEIALPQGGDGVRLTVDVPVKSRVVFFRDGHVIHEATDTLSKDLMVDQRGAYRVEVYLDKIESFTGRRPWIISNPIFVR